MDLSDEELLKLWNTVPHETLKKLGTFKAAEEAVQRAQESSQRRQLELDAQLRNLDTELRELKARRNVLQRELRTLVKGKGKRTFSKETLDASSRPEVRNMVQYFCSLLESHGYSLKYGESKAYGCKNTRPLVTLWVRKAFCDVGIANVYAFDAERLRKVEDIGKASPEHFRLKWSKHWATKESPKWGAERDGKFLKTATFDDIGSLSVAQQVGPAVLQLAAFLDEYWTWYEQHDVDNLDIWEELVQ